MSEPTATTWQIERRSDGVLDFIAVDGTRHADVDIRRGFPFSAPRGGVAVISAAGHELVWIESLDALDPTRQAIVDSVLADREFMPVITHVVSVSEGRPAEWSVQTDRGPHRFSVAHHEDVSRQQDGSMIATDTDGIRYRIPASTAREPRNRRLLDKVL